MKSIILLFVILISFGTVKAQYPYYPSYNYNYYQTEVVTEYEDLGPYGYQNLITRIQMYGYRLDLYTTSISENKFMNLLGYSAYVNMIGTLSRYGYAGTTLSYDYYVDGIWVGRASVVGRMVTRTLYRSRIYQAMNLGRY